LLSKQNVRLRVAIPYILIYPKKSGLVKIEKGDFRMKSPFLLLAKFNFKHLLPMWIPVLPEV
jgi:hypothetical protein